MTLDIDDAAVTALTVDLGSGATLTFDQDLDTTANAAPTLTQLTLTSSGDVTLAEDDAGSALTASSVSKLDVTGVSGDFSTSNIGTGGSFTALTEFKGAVGIDTISVSGAGGTFSGNTGNDDLTFTGMTGGVDVYGGAGKDTVTLDSVATDVDDIFFSDTADFAVTVQTGAATAAGTYDVVQNFNSGEDRLRFESLDLSGNQSIVSGDDTIALAITNLTDATKESVALVDGGDATIDYVVVNLDGSNFGVIDVSGITLLAGDIIV